MSCLERDISKRPPSAAALARRIAQYGTLEALRCAERAERVAIQAGLPLGSDASEEAEIQLPELDGGDDKTIVQETIVHAAHGGAEIDRGPPSQNLPEAVSFYPKPRRIQGRSRIIVAMLAVLFVGTLLGTLITQLKAPSPPTLARMGRAYVREVTFLALDSRAAAETGGTPADSGPLKAPPPGVSADASAAPPPSNASATSSASASAAKPPRAVPPRATGGTSGAPTTAPIAKPPATDNVLLER